MSIFVLDCSVIAAWGLEDEKDVYSLNVLRSLAKAKALVPSLWSYEICNVLLIALKKNRITEGACIQFLNSLNTLPIEVSTTSATLCDLLLLSQKYKLTAYDCAYLELCLTNGYPLATKDEQLKTALKEAGGKLYLDTKVLA